MTTSDGAPDHAFVWIWLPAATKPVVAGRIDARGQMYDFTYGRSYLERQDAIPLYEPELPLVRGRQSPGAGLDIAGCLADAGPDSWGQRVILARHLGRLDQTSDTGDLTRMTYFLESGSDRIGGLDFQASATEYRPRSAEHVATLDDLVQAAERLQSGEILPRSLADALIHGTSIGGARPKALLDDGGRRLIAKFSSAADPYPVVKAEAVAMNLARRVGIDVPDSWVVDSAGKDVLVVERFDRPGGGERRLMISLLTMLGLSEMMGRYATYPDLADLVRERFERPRATLHEIFRRIVFSVATGNTDDHATNHAAFWDGRSLALTPAYDLCPQVRSGNETAQALAIGRDGDRRSRFATCVAAADIYHLTGSEAQEIVDEQVAIIEDEWDTAADEERLTELDRKQLWHRQILNESVFYDD